MTVQGGKRTSPQFWADGWRR